MASLRAADVRRVVRAPILRTADWVLYTGFAYEDPICGRRFRRFREAARRRPQAFCPGCGSAERHRVLWLYLTRELLGQLPNAGLRILHVAPEAGLSKRLRTLPGVSYTSTDLDGRHVTVAADLTNLPFDDEAFDLVSCNHVLEHIPDDIRAMSELRRVVSREGVVLMQHPIDPSRPTTYEDWTIVSPDARTRAFGQFDHVRIYGRDFTARVRTAGFSSIDALQYRDRVPKWELDRYCLTEHPGNDQAFNSIEQDVIYRLAR